MQNTNIKLQLVIKHQQTQKHHLSSMRPSFTKTTGLQLQGSPIWRNQLSTSKSEIIEQCLQTQQSLQLLSPFNQPATAITLLSKLSRKSRQSQYSPERQMSFLKRSQSAKKSSNYFQRTLTRQTSQSKRMTSAKVHIVNQKEEPKTMKLRGHKAKQLSADLRPSTACHDLHVRINDKYRSQTAMSSTRTHQSKEIKSKVEPKVVYPKQFVSARKQKRIMSLNPSKQYDLQYEKKLKNFLDYLFKVNFSYGVYVELHLLPVFTPINRYKIYVQKGNNSLLIKYLIRRRFWYEIVQTPSQTCHFYWTLTPLKDVHSRQTSGLAQGSEKICEANKSIHTLKPHFQFRKQLNSSKTLLNCKFMTEEQSQKAESLILDKGYTVFRTPFTFPCITNRIPGIQNLTVRKNLFLNIKTYFEEVIDEDPSSIIPRTFYFTELQGYTVDFFKHVVENDPKKLWIIKPGEHTSHGQGIQIFPGSKVLARIKERWQQDEQKWTFLVQSYVENPFLYYERKFDIRHFILLTCINGHLKAFWYWQGYIRTASKQYPLVTKIKCKNRLAKKFKNQFSEQLMAWLKKSEIHYTNDYFQCQSEDYGKHEPGNKLSYGDFQKYLDYNQAQYPFHEKTVARMEEIATFVLQSVKGKIDPQRRSCNFQLLAFDYIMHENFDVKLIQIQRNPSLQSKSPILDRVIPEMLEQTIRFCIDPLLPPKNHYPAGERHAVPTDYLAAQKWQLFYEQ